MARIRIITPAPRGSRKGNRITAERYARLLRGLGHRVHVQTSYSGQCADLIIVLHAGKSATALRDFKRCCGDAKLAVLLTGTDVYGGLGGKDARQSLAAADRIIVLQPLAARELPAGLRRKCVTVFQSAVAPPPKKRKPGLVLTVGHLRRVKVPLRPARAVGLLPPESAARAALIGGVIEPALARAARREQAANGRFRWLGEKSPAATLRVIAAAWVLCVPSRAEGGANVIAEACVCGTPVLASRVPGNIGMLGAGYPGYFKVGDPRDLARLIRRCGSDPAFYASLSRWCAGLRARFSPAAEAAALARLVNDLVG
ncbi:MAG: TIGR04348 family glycosyltransferase [Planctomycetes bacterium]|nr:TIGR04348 family glycosyltransferase [Planctomycetota bacterium]